ncbi:MAG TPA: threonine synthase, partial [Bacteroidota bacterium]
MNFLSTNGQAPAVSFRQALLQGLAPDSGLYVPERLPSLPFSVSPDASLHLFGKHILTPLLEEIPLQDLTRIIERAWTFPIPLVKLTDQIYLLELFHGPTLAFKDVGARFMAETLSYVLVEEQRETTILVATSGDTGSAVAHGFYNAPNITVYILYPSGKISRLQEQQMTTLGGNIHAVEVAGTFDDCQRLVKHALADATLVAAHNLTTANSINLGRLLPQVVYYAWAVAQLQTTLSKEVSPTVVVPSGNFGNLTAAAYAKSLGVPIEHFVAATNANDVVPQYLETGSFTPRSSIQTLSNAMDVGNPSNLTRLQALYGNDVGRIRQDISSQRVSDEETIAEIRRTYDQTRVVLDPHTAVGVAAAR